MLYSPSAHATSTASGFFFDGDTHAPSDAIGVAEADMQTAVNLPAGSAYSFSSAGVLTTTAPTPAYLLAQAQAAQIGILQAAYQAAIDAPVSFKNAAGVTSNYPAGNCPSLNGQTATQNLANCINAGASAWTLGKWLDVNNVAQAFVYADLQGLAAAMEAVESVDWTDLVMAVAAVQAATTIAAVQAVTLTAP